MPLLLLLLLLLPECEWDEDESVDMPEPVLRSLILRLVADDDAVVVVVVADVPSTFMRVSFFSIFPSFDGFGSFAERCLSKGGHKNFLKSRGKKSVAATTQSIRTLRRIPPELHRRFPTWFVGHSRRCPLPIREVVLIIVHSVHGERSSLEEQKGPSSSMEDKTNYVAEKWMTKSRACKCKQPKNIVSILK